MAVFLCTAAKQWVAADVAWLINQHDGFSKISTTQAYVWENNQTYADKLSEILATEEILPEYFIETGEPEPENMRYFTAEDISNAANKLALVCPQADLFFSISGEGYNEPSINDISSCITESVASKLVVILNAPDNTRFNETVSIDYTNGTGGEEFSSLDENLQHFMEYNGDIGNRLEEIRSAVNVSVVYIEYEKLLSGDQAEYQTLTSSLGLTPLDNFSSLILNSPNPIKQQ